MMKRALLKCLTSSFYSEILDELLHFDHMGAAELVSCSPGCSSNSKVMKVVVTRDRRPRVGGAKIKTTKFSLTPVTIRHREGLIRRC